MSEITPSTFPGFLLPMRDVEVWPDESTAGAEGSIAGLVEAQVDSRGRKPALTVVATGEQTAGETLELQTTRGGHVGVGGFVAKRSTDSLYYGLDLLHLAGGMTPVAWETTSLRRGAHAIELSTGEELVVYPSRANAAATWNIKAATGSGYSAVNVATGLDKDHVPFPTVCELEDGRVLCAMWWAVDANNEAQMRVDASRDGGATWATHATGALPTPVTINSGSPYYTLRRLRWAATGGQIVLFAHLTADSGTDPEIVRHYASDDDGASFSLIATYTDRGLPDVLARNGRFYVIMVLTGGTAELYDLADAFTAISIDDELAAFGTDIANVTADRFDAVLGTILDGDVALVQWDGKHLAVFLLDRGTAVVGQVYLYDPDTDTTTVLHQSGARTWWQDQSTSTEYPIEFCALVHRRQVHIFCLFKSTSGTYDYQLARLDYGGWANYTLTQPVTNTVTNSRRFSWLRTAIPTGTLADYGWTSTGAGAVSSTTTPGWNRVTTTGAQRWWYIAPTSTVAQGIVASFRVRRVSGGSTTTQDIACGVRLDDGAAGYEVGVNVGSTTIRAANLSGGALLSTSSTLDLAAGVEIVILLSAAVATVLYRQLGSDETERAYTVLQSSTAITDDLGSVGANRIYVGNVATGTATSEHGAVHWSAGSALGVWSVGTVLTNPDNLTPAAWTATPAYVIEGVSVSATTGPAAVGDEYEVPPDARFAQRFLLPRGHEDSARVIRGGEQPSPYVEWRSTATSGRVAFRVRAADEQVLVGGIGGVHIERANFGTASWLGRRSGSWSTIGTIDLRVQALPFRRHGARLRVDTAGTFGSEPWFEEGELAGNHIDFGSGDIFEIAWNSRGRWTNSGTDPLPVVDLVGDVSGLPSSGTVDVWYARGTFIWYQASSQDYEGYALYWGSAQDTAEGYLRAGILPMGDVIVGGEGDDWGWARVMDAGAVVTESEAGARFAREPRPPRRARALSYTTLTPEGWAKDGTGDYFRATSTSGRPVVARRGDSARMLEGLFREYGGGLRPLVYIPTLTRGTPDSYTLVGESAGIYGRLMSESYRIEAASGTRAASVWQGEVYTIEEEK